MNATEQLQYEASTRMRYAVIAFIAGLLLVGSELIQLSGVHTNVNELTLDLIVANKRVPIDQIGSVVDGLGLVALLLTLNWLHHISRARNPDIRNWIRWLVIVGAAVSAVMALAYSILIAVKAHQFVTSGNQSFPEASALTSNGLIATIPFLAQLGSLLLAAGFIWTSLNGLRVGLLTRALGYAGVLSGALVLFPIGAFVTFIQAFWLVAASIMFAGRWLSGNPPAWESGTAIPWQPMAQPRERPAPRSRAGGGAGRSARATLRDIKAKTSTAAAASTETAPVEGDAAVRTRANTPKRKRKRRS